MAAHRYWRATGFETYGITGLDISELQLLSGTTRVDAPATLTSNVAPSVGSLANLKDNDVSTGASWLAGDVKLLAISWDFGGSATDVSDIRIGSAVSDQKFPLATTLQFSDDGISWSTYQSFFGIAWPGVRQKTVSAPAYVFGGPPLSQPTTAVSLDATKQIATLSSFTSIARALTTRSAGIYQFEIVLPANAVSAASAVGVATPSVAPATGLGLYTNSWSWQVAASTSLFYKEGVSTAYGGGFAGGETVGVVVDFTAGSITFYKNGVSQGVAATGLAKFMGGELNPAVGQLNNSAASYTLRMRNFAYPVAGALEWENRDLIRRIAYARGATDVISVASAASSPINLGLTQMREVVRGRKDYLTGVSGQGIGRVRGYTLDYVNPLNRPYPCRVRLMREADGLVVREQWSKADGSYDFQFVDELQSYTVLAYYLAHAKRAVVTDGLTLANGRVELMA